MFDYKEENPYTALQPCWAEALPEECALKDDPQLLSMFGLDRWGTKLWVPWRSASHHDDDFVHELLSKDPIPRWQPSKQIL